LQLDRALFQAQRSVYAVAFSPDGKWIATGGEEAVIRISDAGSGELVHQLTGHTQPVASLRFSPDSKWLASGGVDAAVHLWEAGTWKEHATLAGHGSTVTALAFSPDGKWLASGSLDTSVRLWDPVAGVEKWVARDTSGAYVKFLGMGGTNREVRDVAFTPDGRRVVSVTGRESHGGGVIRFHDVQTGQLAATLEDGCGTALAVSADGRYLVSGGMKGVSVYQAADPASCQPRLLKGQALAVRCCGASGDGRLFACGSDEKTLALYDATSGQLDNLFPLDVACLCLAFHPDRNEIAYNHDQFD
jgi:WD40 repeat protein